MKTLLCIGGPIDGETRPVHDGQRVLMVVTVPPMILPVGPPSVGFSDMEMPAYTEHRYESLRLDSDIEFLYYGPDGPTRAFHKLLACYAPRLAKLAQDEQRRLERQIPPADLQASRRGRE